MKKILYLLGLYLFIGCNSNKIHYYKYNNALVPFFKTGIKEVLNSQEHSNINQVYVVVDKKDNFTTIRFNIIGVNTPESLKKLMFISKHKLQVTSEQQIPIIFLRDLYKKSSNVTLQEIPFNGYLIKFNKKNTILANWWLF